MFADEGASKVAHKQMFWRVFGDIALENLKNNLITCETCTNCRMKVPSWVSNHNCIKNIKDFYTCSNCGVMCERKNSKQKRCEICQNIYKTMYKKIRQRTTRDFKKELYEKRNTRLALSSTET